MLAERIPSEYAERSQSASFPQPCRNGRSRQAVLSRPSGCSRTGRSKELCTEPHMRGHGLLLLRGQEHNLHIGRVPVGEVVGNGNAGSMTTLLGARDGRVSNEEDVPPVKVLSHDVILLNLNKIIYCLVVIR